MPVLTKHFLKTLVIFLGMIMLGLVGVFLVSYFDEGGTEATSNKGEVAN